MKNIIDFGSEWYYRWLKMVKVYLQCHIRDRKHAMQNSNNGGDWLKKFKQDFMLIIILAWQAMLLKIGQLLTKYIDFFIYVADWVNWYYQLWVMTNYQPSMQSQALQKATWCSQFCGQQWINIHLDWFFQKGNHKILTGAGWQDIHQYQPKHYQPTVDQWPKAISPCIKFLYSRQKMDYEYLYVRKSWSPPTPPSQLKNLCTQMHTTFV